VIGLQQIHRCQWQQVSSAYCARQSIVWVHVDRCHQIQAQQGEVGQVVLRQTFAAQVRMDTTQSAKAIDRDTNAFEDRQFNATVIANHHVLNVATAIDQRPNLPAGFV
jgi:hypothetical protein